MMANALMKHFECHTVVQILARVNFVTQVDPLLVAGVKHRQPAPGELVERGVDQSFRALWEREQIGPGQRTGKGAQLAEPEPRRRLHRQQHLLPRPLAARLRIALQRRRREAVKQRIVSRVYRHQLAEDMAGQFADHQPLFRQHAGQIIAVGLAFRSGGHVE